MQPESVIDALAGDPKLKPFVRDRRIGALPAKMWRRGELARPAPGPARKRHGHRPPPPS